MSDLEHQALLELVLAHGRRRLLLLRGLLQGFAARWLTRTLCPAGQSLLLPQVLNRFVHLILRAFGLIDLLDKVRQPLDLLAC